MMKKYIYIYTERTSKNEIWQTLIGWLQGKIRLIDYNDELFTKNKTADNLI